MLYTLAALKYAFHSTRIHSGHVPTRNCQRRDEPQHIAQALHGGELPVGAVATAAHGPGDEDIRHTRREDDRSESHAALESISVNLGQCVGECEGSEPGAVSEGSDPDAGECVRKGERGEAATVIERMTANTG